LRNGYHHLIDSISVDLGGTNIVNQQPYTNLFVSYKMMTTWSHSDVAKYGSCLCFFPDSSSSFSRYAAASADGIGVTNNVITPKVNLLTTVAALAATWPTYATPGYKGDLINKGFLKRLQVTGYDPLTAAGLNGTASLFNTVALAQATARSYFQNNGGAAAARVYYWSLMATIRMRDLHDVFARFPLTKGCYFKITLNYNSSINTITVTNAPTMTINAVGDVTVVGHTNPIMVASSGFQNPNYYTTAPGGNFLIATGVKSATVNNVAVPHTILQSCRMYVPCYLMNATYEQQYLSLHPSKEVIYRDLYQFSVINTAATASFQYLATNGIVNAKSLVLIPFINAAANGPIAINPLTNPFSSEGGTTTPLLAVTQFQVQVSGINIFETALSYGYEQFLREVASVNAINGGMVPGWTSGLIGELDWKNGYGYLVVDLSRRLPLDDSVPKSILVQGVNSSAVAIDLVGFVEYQRSFRIELLTGNLIY
jgi:hypothetical protein